MGWCNYSIKSALSNYPSFLVLKGWGNLISHIFVSDEIKKRKLYPSVCLSPESKLLFPLFWPSHSFFIFCSSEILMTLLVKWEINKKEALCWIMSVVSHYATFSIESHHPQLVCLLFCKWILCGRVNESVVDHHRVFRGWFELCGTMSRVLLRPRKYLLSYNQIVFCCTCTMYVPLLAIDISPSSG